MRLVVPPSMPHNTVGLLAITTNLALPAPEEIKTNLLHFYCSCEWIGLPLVGSPPFSFSPSYCEKANAVKKERGEWSRE